MSMWEIEALAEEAVSMVQASELADRDKRNTYANIYSVTGGFDTSFTHFRNVDALTEVGFFVRIDLAQHPDYASRKVELEALTRDTWLDGYEAYVSVKGIGEHPPGIWFDVTMPLWKKAVDAGLVKGLAAEPVEMWSPAELIARLMALADQMARPRLLKMVHGFAAMAVPDAKRNDPRLAPALALPGLAAALRSSGTEGETWIDERFDAREALKWVEDEEQQAFLRWWCAPYGDD